MEVGQARDDEAGAVEGSRGVIKGDGNGNGSGGVGGLDADGGILEDDAAVRGKCEALGGQLEDLRIGLAAGDVVAADDGADEVADAHGVEDEFDVGERPGRADGQAHAQPIQLLNQLDCAGYDGGIGSDQVAVDRFFSIGQFFQAVVLGRTE